VGALAADRQTTTMAMSAIAVDAENALHVHLKLTTKVAFDRNLHPLHGLGDRGDLFVAQLTCPDVRVNVGGGKNLRLMERPMP
jgi:hypothetical protein